MEGWHVQDTEVGVHGGVQGTGREASEIWGDGERGRA
jgi:hypothetical protein